MANIEHSILGPFYFGAAPSYVDYFMLHAFDWAIDDTFLRALAPKLAARGIDVYAPFPKIRRLLATLRSLPSYKQAQHPYPFNVDYERVSPRLVAAY